jgi:hypothetical protein
LRRSRRRRLLLIEGRGGRDRSRGVSGSDGRKSGRGREWVGMERGVRVNRDL